MIHDTTIHGTTIHGTEGRSRLPSTDVRRRRRLIAAVACVAAGLPAAPLLAQGGYPSQPVNVLVPYAPGGQGDVFARLLAEPLAQALGQPVVVENRPGASGAIGARLVARAKPDGHSLLMGQTGEIAVNGSVMKNPGYDTLKDLRAVVLVGDAPLVMVAPVSAPYDTLEALIERARGKPGSVAYASSGTATPGHLAAAALAIGTRTEMVHVPYKGAGQAMTDVIGGQVQFFFSSASAAMPHVKNGKLKVLAVSSAKRLAALPDVPTVAEKVLPGFRFSLWGGYFVPAGTPDAVVARLNREVNTILREPAIRDRFVADGSWVEPSSPEAFDRMVRDEIGKYAQIIRTAGIQID